MGKGFVHERTTPFGAALEVERWRLHNGLTVLLLRDSSAPVVSYHTWFRVGSRHEEPGKTGLAHFFEHLMFNETETLGWGEFDRRMEDAGGDTNAATWIDWTYYYESLPSDELPLAIELEADRMARLKVKKPQVESEREVVANERRMAVEDSVRGKAEELLAALAYGPSHPHGWPTIGWMQDIEGYRVADCRAFYRTWYAPNNATVVVVGDLEPADTLDRMAAAYGRMRPSDLPVRPAPRASRQRAPREQTLRWPTPAEKLAFGWHAPAEGARDHAVAEMIHDVLIGGRSARLVRELVDELEIATRVRGHVGGLKHAGLFELWIELREGIAGARAREAVDHQIARLIDDPVPAAELDKVKARAELFTLGSIETMSDKAYQIGFGQTVVDDPAHVLSRLEEIRAVTPDDVRRVAAKMLRPGRRSIVHVVPEAA